MAEEPAACPKWSLAELGVGPTWRGTWAGWIFGGRWVYFFWWGWSLAANADLGHCLHSSRPPANGCPWGRRAEAGRGYKTHWLGRSARGCLTEGEDTDTIMATVTATVGRDGPEHPPAGHQGRWHRDGGSPRALALHRWVTKGVGIMLVGHQERWHRDGGSPRAAAPRWWVTKGVGTTPVGHRGCWHHTGGSPRLLAPHRWVTKSVGTTPVGRQGRWHHASGSPRVLGLHQWVTKGICIMPVGHQNR